MNCFAMEKRKVCLSLERTQYKPFCSVDGTLDLSEIVATHLNANSHFERTSYQSLCYSFVFCIILLTLEHIKRIFYVLRGYQSFRHTVISSHLNHYKVGLTVSLCRRRTSSRPKRKSALGYAVVFVCVCCYFRPSIMNQQDR